MENTTVQDRIYLRSIKVHLEELGFMLAGPIRYEGGLRYVVYHKNSKGYREMLVPTDRQGTVYLIESKKRLVNWKFDELVRGSTVEVLNRFWPDLEISAKAG